MLGRVARCKAFAAVFAAALAGSAGCDGNRRGAPGADGGAGGAPGPQPAPFPANFLAAPCLDREKGPGLTIACGTIALPEDETHPGLGNITLRVARISADRATSTGAPVVYLDGGPGGSSIANAIYYGAWTAGSGLKALLAERELIAIDLRGTGGSTPALTCDGVDIKTLGPGEPAADEFSAAAISACRMSLASAGVTLANYGTAAAAHDVSSIVAALKLTKFDLVGVSYGARVALELLRSAPPGLNAVVLDSLIPPEANAITQEGVALARAYDLVLAACARDAACAAEAPDVQSALPEIVARLDQMPADVNTHGGAVTLNGRSFLEALRGALRDGDRLGYVPRQLQAARGGDYGFFAAVLGAPHGQGSVGVNLSVMCGEEFPADGAAAIEAAAAAVPPPLAHGLAGRFYAHACPLWAPGKPSPTLHQPVTTKQPMLLLAGELDPLVPPNGSSQAAMAASAAHVAEVVGAGHAMLHGTCVGVMTMAYLNQGTVPPERPACQGANPD
jgi:pimeloyl-ACP methyl ester carboxylesterase